MSNAIRRHSSNHLRTGLVESATSKMKRNFALYGTWSHKVRAGKARKKIVESDFVRQIYSRQFCTYGIMLFLPHLGRPERNVEQVPRGDAGRVRIRVVGSCRYDVNPRCSELRGTAASQRRSDSRERRAARGLNPSSASGSSRHSRGNERREQRKIVHLTYQISVVHGPGMSVSDLQ